MKFVPFTVSVNEAAPAVILAGEREVAVGTGLEGMGSMVKIEILELPPPGVPLKTVILADPALTTRGAAMAAVNCIEFTNEVVRAEPFHLTTDPLIKLVPFTVRVKAGLPAVVFAGEMDIIAGTGLLPAVVMMKGKAFDVPPPGSGVTTVTVAVPAIVIRAAFTTAVNCKGPTNVVVSAVPFQ